MEFTQDITPLILTLIFVSGFIAVAYDQFAMRKGWVMKPWMRGNSFVKLSGVFSIFMAPALAFHLLPWGMSIFIIIVGSSCFYLLVLMLKKYAPYFAVVGLSIGWLWFATRLVNL